MSHRLLLAALLGACTGPAPFQPGLDTDTDTDAGTDSDPFWPEDTDPLSRVDQDGDGVPASKDCNDLNPLVNPSQTEKCNGADDDCDGQIDQSDEPFSGATGPYFRDEDIDGFGAETSKRFFCSAPNDWTLKGGDCDDTRASIRPGAVEICDDVDNDCDGLTDGEDLDLNVQGSPDAVFRYVDGDGDGVGDGDGQWLCFEPAQGWADDDGDCDDTNPLVNPSASETCNGLDDDCNGKIDADDSGIDASLVEWGHRDADGDGFGTTSTSSSNRQRFCKGALPSGWVLDNTDCDDSRDTRFPGNPEICDKGIDNDCDNKVDAADDSVRQSDLVQLWRDADSDTFGTPSNTQMACDNARPSGWVTNAQDCDDTRNAVKPGATEICNSLDDDCDLKTDDEDDSVNVTNPWLIDKDGDGYPDTADKRVQCTKPGANAYPTSGSGSKAADCDDDDIDTWPGAAENESGSSCRQDRDKDGYGAKVPAKAGVTAGTDCDDTQYTTRPGAEDAWYDGVDANCDGKDDYDQDGDGVQRRPEGNDCDDTKTAIKPGAVEICDEIDNDCDDKIDDDDPDRVLSASWYLDEDGDGFPNPHAEVTACAQPEKGYRLTSINQDCDDADVFTFPGAAERESGSATTCRRDRDEDGYGDNDQGLGNVGITPGSDCDDTVATTFPGAAQKESSTACRADADDDGYGDDQPPQGVTAGGDCDDAVATTFPGAVDAWYDGVDADCGGEDDYDQDGDGERRRPEANDCDDTVATVLPGADEVCDDIDNDCDDKIDEADPGLIANVWFLDEDGDGWAGRAVSLTQCDRPTDDHHLSTELEDCDDDDLDTYPGAAELESEVLCMTDGDGDGYGAEVVEAGVQAGLDCVDDDDTINPEAFDIPQNEIDEDCSGADSECDYGDETCPAVDCQDLKLVRPDAPTGVYWLMPPGTATKMQARCEMTVAGGGYTLVMISANDGAARWTWNNSSYWGTNITNFGDPNTPTKDYRWAPLLDHVPMRDILFIHRPSGKYAEYRLVGTEQSLASWMSTNMASPRCYGSGTGIPLRSGTITTSSTTLCSTSLMWNAQDQDGSTTCQSSSSSRAWGFHWSAYNGQACPLDDPSQAGLGPESGSISAEIAVIGFGRALGLNTGTAGTGANRMEIYIRR